MLYGSDCNNAKLVIVPSLGDLESIDTHYDLDVFLWLPGCSISNCFFSDLRTNRRMVPYCESESDRIYSYVNYTFIFYDQVISSFLFLPTLF